MIKPVNPEGNQIHGRTDAKGEAPILWPSDVKSSLIGKDPDAGKIGGRKRRGRQRMEWLDYKEGNSKNPKFYTATQI